MGFMTTIGLMSGTSLDGIDVALLETDGKTVKRFGPTGYFAYGEAERNILRAALKDAESIRHREDRPGCLKDAEKVITREHEAAVKQFMQENSLAPEQIDLIGFHGQTVLHRPEERLTVQLGYGQDLASALSIPVIYDFRSNDVLAGGQGAPLVPIFHQALMETAGLTAPLAFVNIGGVANVTLLDKDGNISSFDTGPGNALVDDWVHEHTGLAYDVDGRLAAQGVVDDVLLATLLAHPFFSQKPPKSLDRNWFTKDIVRHLSLIDGAATLTAFTICSLVRALEHANIRPQCWILAGGGAQNNEMRRQLAERSGIDVIIADDVGLSSSFLEAQAFGFLAARSIKGLPLSYPSTTGVPEPMTGGTLARPDLS